MQPRTDLAMEAKALYERSAQEQTKLSGVIAREQERHGVRMTVVKITSAEGEQALGKPRGTYITAELEALTRREPGSFSNAARTVGRALRELLGPCRQALVVGLGNRDITPDAIGPEAVKNLIVTHHLQAGQGEALPGLMRVAACQPGVLAQTGIESLELVKCAMQTAQPDVVIVIDALAAAEPEEIEAIVKPCGLGHSKARDISACMRILHEQYHDKVPEDFNALLKLPGVGRKSANLIMGDVFGKPAIVTDTHCIRLSNRIGLVHDMKDPKKVEMALWKIIPPEEGNDLCHRFVYHGREVCTARTKPYCDRCCLNDVCKKMGVE